MLEAGATRVPQPPARGLCPHLPGGGEVGTPGFPSPLHEGTRPHLPGGGEVGTPGFPSPLRAGCALTFPGAGVWGSQVPHGHVRRSCAWRTPPAAHGPGARASRPRRGAAGTVTAPLPSPPPAGGGESGSTPQRGEGRRGGQRRMRVGEQPMFTLAVHAAPPHTNRMNIGSSWEGCALPNPPAGGGMGKPGFPIPLRGGGVGKPGFPTPLFKSLCSR